MCMGVMLSSPIDREMDPPDEVEEEDSKSTSESELEVFWWIL